MRRHPGLLIVAFLALASILFMGYRWKKDEPKRNCIQALQIFRTALDSSDAVSLLKYVAAPQAVRGKTPQEQAEFVRKALHNEISEDGLRQLAKRGTFGPLSEIFPNDGKMWAAQAGVKLDDCVALRYDGKSTKTQVVLEVRGDAYRIVRCYNVKAMAGTL